MPSMNDELQSVFDRREFLKILGASMALTTLASCRNRLPPEEVLAYRSTPPGMVLGQPRYYATTFPQFGFIQGLLVESHEGRPTKIEGNPLHPASRGATSIFAQASILDLYSPYRLKTVVRKDQGTSNLKTFRSSLKSRVELHRSRRGSGLAVLTGTITSPTLLSQLESLLARFPKARWHSYEPVNQDQVYEGLRQATGRACLPRIDFARADRVLSIDCDFLGTEPSPVAHAQEYMNRRRAEGKSKNRLYVFEPGVTITGTKADHRWSVPSSRLGEVLDLLRSELSTRVRRPAATRDEFSGSLSSLANDLRDHRGRCVITAGFAQPPGLHKKVHDLNLQLGNIGKTLSYRPPPHLSHVAQADSISALVDAMKDDQIGTLIVLGGNPAYDAPRNLGFARAMQQVGYTAHLTTFENETSRSCDWSVPESHYLESWGDAESFDGTISLIQPLITPLYESVCAHDILNHMAADEANRSPLETVRAYWKKRLRGSDFEQEWKSALQEGVIAQTKTSRIRPAQFKHRRPTRGIASVDSTRDATQNTTQASESLELIIRPDATIWDGRFSENAWLQELPKPPSQLTWDNALYISPDTASRHGIKSGDVISAVTPEGELQAAAWILPGIAKGTLSLSLGYGREASTPVSQESGFNAYRVRTMDRPWHLPITSLKKTGRNYDLATTQRTDEFGQRDLIRTIAAQKNETDAEALPAPSVHESANSATPYQWGMSIDLDSCIGCSACVVACQAENNIPVVGKRMVMMGREMHWIRIDRYLSDAESDPELQANGVTVPEPVTCMQCEKAPCEVVCPVAATVHSADGLNQQVYNRCVGTRYCSNNCPYKVRRFNFFKFSETAHETVKMQRNPNVTVRSRGVMEKCTYCVQRIEQARIQSQKENRLIRDGEVQTACQQVCPTRAIVFGNIVDPRSRVSQARSSPRTYRLLEELGTRPRTTYLARILNSNPSLVEAT